MANGGLIPKGLRNSTNLQGDFFGGDSFLFSNKGYTALSPAPGSECWVFPESRSFALAERLQSCSEGARQENFNPLGTFLGIVEL
jgi:hypothetical protein